MILNPSISKYLHGSKTAGCSIIEVIMCLPFSLFASAAPMIAWLLLSVPPLVKTISSISAPIREATCSLDFSTASLGIRP